MNARGARRKNRPTELLRCERVGERLGFFAADELTRARLKAKGIRIGDEVAASMKKPRVGWFHRKAHVFGDMVAQNVEEFEGKDAHETLKRLQLEADVECEVLMVDATRMWDQITDAIVQQGGEHLRPALQVVGTFLKGMEIPVRIPRSIAFDVMDQTAFERVVGGLYDWVVKRYWPNLDRGAIDDMANLHLEAA